MGRPIVLLIGEHRTSAYVYQAIRNLGVTHVIQEDGPSEHRPESLNHWLTHAYVRSMAPLMRVSSRARIQELKGRYPLNDEPIPFHHILRVTSLNDAKTTMWLDRLESATHRHPRDRTDRPERPRPIRMSGVDGQTDDRRRADRGVLGVPGQTRRL
ncbi:hypothetical protein [Exiguobacterium mexicanum]|uniref:hypothetical protein n=1 Tax=Exiguobacterium mexicanum TaxID=340146 RepID=UPI0037C0FE28